MYATVVLSTALLDVTCVDTHGGSILKTEALLPQSDMPCVFQQVHIVLGFTNR